MRSRLIGALCMCVILSASTVLPVAASDPTYLALGDSVAFGYRSGLNPSDYLNTDNFDGYAERVATSAHFDLANASCPGETSGSLILTSNPDNGCQAYRNAPFPLHVAYGGAQLDFAVDYLRAHSETRLVTIDVGANDLFLLQAKCLGSTVCVQQGLPTLLNGLANHLNTIFTRLRRDGQYHQRLVALTYYVSNYRDPNQVEVVSALNLFIAALTLAHGGAVADGFGAFARASALNGGDACAAGLLARLSSGGCDIHPSPTGHDVLARAIGATIHREEQAGK